MPPERAAGLRTDCVPPAHEDGNCSGQEGDQLLLGQCGEEPEPGQDPEKEGEEGREDGGEVVGLQTAAHRGRDSDGQEQGPVKEEPTEGSGESQGHPAEGPVQHLSAGQDLQQWKSTGLMDFRSHTSIFG